jgi:hypothetical protein
MGEGGGSGRRTSRPARKRVMPARRRVQERSTPINKGGGTLSKVKGAKKGEESG